MIAYLKGTIKYVTKKYLVVEINNIGYQVFVINKILEYGEKNINKEIELFTYYYLRENIVALYGFSNKEEVEMFQVLLDISGIGPKLALNILSLDMSKLINAIRNNQIDYLTSISGIGTKTAERMIVELKNKINNLTIAGNKIITLNEEDEDVLEALIGLGYKINDIRNILDKIPAGIKGASAKVKYVLSKLKK